MTKRKKTMTEAEFMAALGPGEPLEVLQARHNEDVAQALANKDKDLSGDLLRVRLTRGRPPKGQEAPVQLKALKMPAAFWQQMEDAAKASGLNLHAAMREAVTKWTVEHRPKAG
jgi:hypothetical protein